MWSVIYFWALQFACCQYFSTCFLSGLLKNKHLLPKPTLTLMHEKRKSNLLSQPPLSSSRSSWNSPGIISFSPNVSPAVSRTAPEASVSMILMSLGATPAENWKQGIKMYFAIEKLVKKQKQFYFLFRISDGSTPVWNCERMKTLVSRTFKDKLTVTGSKVATLSNFLKVLCQNCWNSSY